MPAKGKHRRPKKSPISRGMAVAGTSGAALALPLVGATVASAAGQSAPAATSAHTAAHVAEAAKTAAPQAGTATTYSVVKGDSLSTIAHEHDVDGGWKALYQDNKKAVGDNPRVIRPGQKLSVDGDQKPAKSEAKKASTEEKSAKPTEAKQASYPDNLDGWINEALSIMKEKGIPGSYDGIHRNIMRESGGDPNAQNGWDINAQNGTPSKGLLQVIQPTFDSYHVEGTSTSLTDPVANIVAACNYAADRYGSIDNVNGPY
ncbi:LysM peptidoglycan-binding domain-containing protein [Streptomyces sp. A7024]|uniref:LysM peptidoglycan-binding domain-containing protein n=1 Tax=Streptomyces coryli TaxID=1128680 RepID=A0A6G4TXU4_9ACTN|nr:transglycosylase SLT domain-containing protein [Streptomyces coryli]NGN64829.1 LysM peptidoglycan-binding domain-containing protein [Streptomyces coryli]